jgi:hypothetical protein
MVKKESQGKVRGPYVFKIVCLLGVEVGWGCCRHCGYALERHEKIGLEMVFCNPFCGVFGILCLSFEVV